MFPVAGSDLALIIGASGMIRFLWITFRVNGLYPTDMPSFRNETITFDNKIGG